MYYGWPKQTRGVAPLTLLPPVPGPILTDLHSSWGRADGCRVTDPFGQPCLTTQRCLFLEEPQVKSVLKTPLEHHSHPTAQDPQVFIHLQGPILQPLSLLRFFHILFLPDLCGLKASVIIGVTAFSCFMRNSALYSLQFSFFKSCYFFFPTIVVI